MKFYVQCKKCPFSPRKKKKLPNEGGVRRHFLLKVNIIYTPKRTLKGRQKMSALTKSIPLAEILEVKLFNFLKITWDNTNLRITNYFRIDILKRKN